MGDNLYPWVECSHLSYSPIGNLGPMMSPKGLRCSCQRSKDFAAPSAERRVLEDDAGEGIWVELC